MPFYATLDITGNPVFKSLKWRNSQKWTEKFRRVAELGRQARIGGSRDISAYQKPMVPESQKCHGRVPTRPESKNRGIRVGAIRRPFSATDLPEVERRPEFPGNPKSRQTMAYSSPISVCPTEYILSERIRPWWPPGGVNSARCLVFERREESRLPSYEILIDISGRRSSQTRCDYPTVWAR